MHCIRANFDKILLVLKQCFGSESFVEGNVPRRGTKPRFTDIEIVALSLTAESMGIDSELYLFNLLQTSYREQFPTLIGRRQYNHRRRALFPIIEQIRFCVSSLLSELSSVFAVDSMPLEVCKMARMNRNKMGKDQEHTTPDKGYCAAQDRYYYGYKLHATCTPSGVIKSLDLTRASVHDSNYLTDVSHVLSDCILTGDRAYIVNETSNKRMALKRSNIHLEAPTRRNQKEKKKPIYALKKIRKRIETVFSQLCDQFRIQRNYAKGFSGYSTRIISKITAMTILQYINKFINDRPLGQVKYALR